MTEDRRVWLVVTGSYSDYQVECAAGSGGGLHLSPTTSQATTYRPDASRWVRVEVPVGDIVPIPSLLSGSVAKCKVRTCRVRVWPWDGTRRPT